MMMRDFRLIRKFEVDWKDMQRQMDDAKRNLGNAGRSSPRGGGINLEELVAQLADDS